MGTQLENAVAAALGDALPEGESPPGLAARLARSLCELADLGVEVEVAAAGAAQRLVRIAPDDLERGAAELPTDDLVLALACARGHGGAIRRFEDRHFGGIAPALARMGLGEDDIDEVTQTVRERLFVTAPGDEPRILGAIGGGNLRAFVRVTAVRLALNLRRRDRRLVDEDDAVLEFLAPAIEPAAGAQADRDHALVRRAFEQALAKLDKRQRAVLRLHLFHRLGIDDIARTYGVHRATAARWVARVRSDLERDTRRILRGELAGDSVDGLLRAVQSQLEISFERLLASADGATG